MSDDREGRFLTRIASGRLSSEWTAGLLLDEGADPGRKKRCLLLFLLEFKFLKTSNEYLHKFLLLDWSYFAQLGLSPEGIGGNIVRV